jgi:hypothetical protein
MLPNFTVVICGAVLTVLMLAVAGSGLIAPETHTRIGAMPEISRPMMQRMIAEPAAREQFAALEMSRRAEELVRLRDLAPAVADPAPTAAQEEPVQPAADFATLAPRPPSDVAGAPAASTEAVPAAIPEAAPAAVAEQPTGSEAVPVAIAEPISAAAAPVSPSTEAAPTPVAIAEPTPPVAAEEPPSRDTAGAPAPEDTKFAAEPAAESLPAASPIAPPVAEPERVAAAPSSEPPTEDNELAEPPASAPQQLALAEPDAVPAPEAPAKLAARTGEPEEAAPVRRLVPRFVPRLPRIIPVLSRPSPPRLAPVLPRATPTWVWHVHARARPEPAKADIAKAALPPRKPVHHYVVRQVQHRAQRTSAAPNSVTSGAQYR